MTSVASAVTSYLEGTGTDHRGRSVSEIIAFDDHELEVVHDYIQWLFPLPEASAFNPFAPVLSPMDIEVLRKNAKARDNLAKAAARMLQFYRHSSHWLTAMDHNHLRISRIIRSLALILGSDDAQYFHRHVLDLVNRAGSPVAQQALEYWRQAAQGNSDATREWKT
jgi:hypothetical protein